MKHQLILALILHFSFFILHSASAAVPLRWTVETSRAQPATFEAYQGETLDLEAALQSYGKPLEAPLDYAFYWQTNGMGNAWWSVPVQGSSSSAGTGTSHSNCMHATWLPSYDVGARAYNCFIGLSNSIYHAAFQLRLRPSPGAVPNELPLPQKVIDFSQVTVLNPPWSGGSGSNLDTNTVADIANHAIATNATVSGKLSMINDDGTASVSWDGDVLNFSYGINVHSSPSSFPAELDGFYFGERTMQELLDEKRDIGDNNFSGEFWLGEGDLNIFSPFGVYAYFAHIRGHETLDEGWSNITVSTSESTETLPEYLDRRLPSSPNLRVYDAARGCWWIGAMVDGVINWTVEE